MQALSSAVSAFTLAGTSRVRTRIMKKILVSVLHVLGAAVAVVLAGLFLFPVNAHASPDAAAVEKGMQRAGLGAHPVVLRL